MRMRRFAISSSILSSVSLFIAFTCLRPPAAPARNMPLDQAFSAMGLAGTVPAQQPMSPMSLILFPKGFDRLPDQLAIQSLPADAVKPQTKEHWDPWKPIIQRLYCDYNLPLDDVIAVMNARFHFFAR